MALSNIFREPRREITEQVIGSVVVSGLVIADYKFARWFEIATIPVGACPWPVGMVLGVVAGIAVLGVVLAAHGLGDAICNRLAEAGMELRPRTRR